MTGSRASVSLPKTSFSLGEGLVTPSHPGQVPLLGHPGKDGDATNRSRIASARNPPSARAQTAAPGAGRVRMQSARPGSPSRRPGSPSCMHSGGPTPSGRSVGGSKGPTPSGRSIPGDLTNRSQSGLPRPVTAAVTKSEKVRFERLATRETALPTGVNMALGKLKKYMMSSGRDAYEAFRDFDPDGNWKITYSEFEDILVRTGIPISNTTRKALFGFIDENSDGCIDYREFTRAVLTQDTGNAGNNKIYIRASDILREENNVKTVSRAQTAAAGQRRMSKKLINANASSRVNAAEMKERDEVTSKMAMTIAKQKMKGLFGGDGVQLHKAFGFFDRDGSGTLSVKEFSEAFGLMSIHISETEMHRLAKSFDRDGNGMVDYAEFLAHFAPRNFTLYKPLHTIPTSGGNQGEVEHMAEVRTLMHKDSDARRVREEKARREAARGPLEKAGMERPVKHV